MFFIRRERGPKYGEKDMDAVRTGPCKLRYNLPMISLHCTIWCPRQEGNLIADRPKVASRLQAAIRRDIQRGAHSVATSAATVATVSNQSGKALELRRSAGSLFSRCS